MPALKKLVRTAPTAPPSEPTEQTEWSCPYVRFEERASTTEYMQMSDNGLFMGTSVWLPNHVFDGNPPERIEIIIRKVQE